MTVHTFTLAAGCLLVGLPVALLFLAAVVLLVLLL